LDAAGRNLSIGSQTMRTLKMLAAVVALAAAGTAAA
jgi:hypothetical protein